MTAISNPQTVTLTPNGPTIPALGVGTWAWGDSLFWNYGKAYGRPEVEAAFSASIEAGVNFFDTAEVYGLGESERLLGQFSQAHSQPVILATKYFPLPCRFSRQAVADTLTASLERLQRDSIALYQVHMPFDLFLGQQGLMEALAHEVHRGRIKAVGVSNYSASQMREAHQYLKDQGVPLAVNQAQYSLLHRDLETNGVLATARELGITVLAYSPLAQGLLTGKYQPEMAEQPSGARRLNPRFKAEGLKRLQPLLSALQSIAARYNRTPAQVALNWLICQGVVPIPGAKNAQQASQNAGALGWQLDPRELKQLSSLTQDRRSSKHI